MDVLKTFGFLHPGLTTKKVLLTKEGQVKLFDFCLAGDAPKIAALKKAQVPTVTLNQFPPEMLLLNHYTETSDVWSTAVVIWEIMAAGNPPFPVNKEVTSVDGEATTPSAPWPEKYLQIKDKILFDCWNHNSSLRPSIHHLRGTFVAIFEKLIADSSHEIPIPTTHLPMRAPDTAQPSYAEHIYHAGM
ncbi:fibroblast growth factor receptor 1-like [Apostichopus japonicus]|uniref:fibroblast growth factor receptor 1-like n=1 Tax=Stichopus japonicus TaxID=307972 RepID=UPI003AB71680